jgi:hypothetical protein
MSQLTGEPTRYITTGFQNEQFSADLLKDARKQYSQFLGKESITACMDSDGQLVWGEQGNLGTVLGSFGAIAMDSHGRTLAFDKRSELPRLLSTRP